MGLPNPAAMFLRRNRGLIDAITGYLNKQQQLHALVGECMSGKEFPVNLIDADRVLQLVDERGPKVLEQVLLAMDKQMDRVRGIVIAAVEEAAKQQGLTATIAEVPADAPASPDGASIHGPSPASVTIEADAAEPEQPPM